MSGKRNRGKKTVPIKQEEKTIVQEDGVIGKPTHETNVMEAKPEHTALHNRHIDKTEEVDKPNLSALLKVEVVKAFDICGELFNHSAFGGMSADHPLAGVHSRINGAIVRLKQARDML